MTQHAVLATCLLALVPFAAEGSSEDTSADFGVTPSLGYRNWELISVAHKAGSLNDFRAILGNDVAIKAFREGIRPFPDETIPSGRGARLSTGLATGRDHSAGD